MHLIRRFRSLDDADRWLVVEAALLLTFVSSGLAIVRFPRLRRMLDCYAGLARPGTLIDNPVLRIAKAIERGSRHSRLRTTCLVQALAADAMLRRHGVPSVLHLGVLGQRPGRGQLEAHAWVDSDGVVVTGRTAELSNYVELSPMRTAPRALHQ
jgi:hypothetical protein